ncbi:MAG: PKD domain-containing protein [Bacteroidota bacterium]
MAALKKIAGVLGLLMMGLITYAQNYLEFVENKGQWDKKILYLANTGIGSVALQADGYRVLLHNEEDLEKLNPHPGGHQHTTTATTSVKKSSVDEPSRGGEGGAANDLVLRGHAYQVKFLNANPNAQVVPDKAQATYNNYILGNDPSKWTSNCKIYQAVTFRNIYPNIDIRYYTANGTLKYDLIVHPGGNINDVNFYFDGVDGLKVRDQQLIIKTSVLDVQEMTPYTYQLGRDERTEVPCNFEVKGNIVRFRLNGAYNKDAAVVIDPSIVFYGYSGSSAENWGFTATYDAQGNFYGGGIVFQPGTFPVNNGAFQKTFQGGVNEGQLNPNDIAIIKFDPSGVNRIYATYLGGTGNEQPHSLVVDGQGNLFIAGRTTSGNSYPTRGLGLYGSGGGADIIITKLNAAGSDIISSLRIGGTRMDGVNVRPNYTSPVLPETTRRNYGDDARSEIILDASGNPILASVTQSTDFVVTANAFQTTPGGTTNNRFQDGVLIKLTPDLNTVLFSSFLGGDGDDAAFVLATHPQNGNIYVAGGTASTNFPGNKTGVVYPAYNGGVVDGFVSIINSDGSQIIKTSYFATNGIDIIYGIQFDRNGYPYIMGTTTVAWPVINAPINANNSQTNGKQFISKLQPDLSAFIYSTNFGTINGTIPNISPTAFLVDRCENVYVSGWGGLIDPGLPLAGTSGMMTAGSGQFKSNTDGRDFYFYVIERDAQSVLYATFFGSTTGSGGAPYTDHVDGGTSRFDRNGTIYQSICSCMGDNPPPGSVLTGTAGVWARNNGNTTNAAKCNLLAIKFAFDLAGVGAGLQASINGVARDTAGCVPLTVDFRDTLAQGKAYWWHFGDGTPAVRTTTPSISHTYNNVGLYRVMLVAVDSTTCNFTDTAYINMRVRGDEAALSFTSTKIPPCESLVFEFNNTSVAPAGKPFTNQSFRWDFGDGTTRIAGPGIVTHSYAAGGTYDVKLVLIDTNYCNHADSIMQQIRIAPNVDARFTTPAVGCAPYNAVFNNTSLAGQQFFWDFGDGSTSTATSPTHLYPTPGTYTVTLIAIDNATCNLRDTTTQTITVSGSPTAAFTYTPNPTEPNTAVSFHNGSTGGVSYKWLFGDGDSTVTTDPDTAVPHLYNRTGTYNACLIVYNAAGCSNTTCQSISVTVNATAAVPNAFSPNGDGTNDRIFVRGYGIGKMTWRIYNRWGVQVYVSNNQAEGWDGRYKGRIQPQDVYHYTLQIEFTNGDKVSKKGDITLLR